MKKIAIEEHFHTEGFVKYLFSRTDWPRREYIEENGKKLVREWWSPNACRLFDAGVSHPITDVGEGRIAVMDEAGIDMQVLSLSFPGVEFFDAADATAVARDVNDEIASVIEKHPSRFAGFATVAPQAPESAADELERAVTTLGLKGAMINGHIQGEYLDSKKFWPIFERASALDVPVYIHPKMPSPDMIKPYLGYPGLASALLGFAADASLHAMRLILSGVFDTYPRLKIVLGHLGEALPFWLWRMDSRFEEEKTDPASAAFYKDYKKMPAECFKENFYVTISGMFWEPVLKFTCSVLGSDRVLFATDYPYESSTVAAKFMEEAHIDEGDRARICHGNAEKLLKL